MITLTNYNDKQYTFKNKQSAINWLKGLGYNNPELDCHTHIVYTSFTKVWGTWIEE